MSYTCLVDIFWKIVAKQSEGNHCFRWWVKSSNEVKQNLSIAKWQLLKILMITAMGHNYCIWLPRTQLKSLKQVKAGSGNLRPKWPYFTKKQFWCDIWWNSPKRIHVLPGFDETQVLQAGGNILIEHSYAHSIEDEGWAFFFFSEFAMVKGPALAGP